MYDLSKLKTAAECRIVMDRARKQGRSDIYGEVFKRYCELEGSANEDPADPLVKDFYETLAAYEQLLTEKMGGRRRHIERGKRLITKEFAKA